MPPIIFSPLFILFLTFGFASCLWAQFRQCPRTPIRRVALPGAEMHQGGLGPFIISITPKIFHHSAVSSTSPMGQFFTVALLPTPGLSFVLRASSHSGSLP